MVTPVSRSPVPGQASEEAVEVSRIAATLDGDLHLHHAGGQCEPINPEDLVRHVLGKAGELRDDFVMVECWHCHGGGEVGAMTHPPDPQTFESGTCPTCSGHGSVAVDRYEFDEGMRRTIVWALREAAGVRSDQGKVVEGIWPTEEQLADLADHLAHWRCECGDLNRDHESFCYRCGAGPPEPSERTFTGRASSSPEGPGTDG